MNNQNQLGSLQALDSLEETNCWLHTTEQNKESYGVKNDD